MIDFKRMVVTFKDSTPLEKRHQHKEIFRRVSDVEQILTLEDKGYTPMPHARLVMLQDVANTWQPGRPGSMGAYMSELIQEVRRLQDLEVELRSEIQRLEQDKERALRMLENKTPE